MFTSNRTHNSIRVELPKSRILQNKEKFVEGIVNQLKETIELAIEECEEDANVSVDWFVGTHRQER